IGFGAEAGVADDVEVGKAGEAEGFGDAASSGGFDIEDAVGLEAGRLYKLEAGVEGADERGFVLAAAEQAIASLVRGVEGAMGLEDNVGLAGDQVTGI